MSTYSKVCNGLFSLVFILISGILPPAVEGASTSPTLLLNPTHLVFSAVAGQACPTVQLLRIIGLGIDPGQPLTWTRLSGSSWIGLDAASGSVPSTVKVTVNPAGLAPGLYKGTLGIGVSGLSNSPQTVRVTLIINPTGRVRVSTWKDGHRGAFSVSVDDGLPTGFEVLEKRGLGATYYLNGDDPPAYFAGFYLQKMEFGSHLFSHVCLGMDGATLRLNIERNLSGLSKLQPGEDCISMAWPCGDFNALSEQAVASDYFLSARGYDINALEDSTPVDLMNLKTFNSHEDAPYPPVDLKVVIDEAEAKQKWANLVFHSLFNDDGAVQYGATKDLWVAPIGSVTKYILQRDRTLLTGYSESSSAIQFDMQRLALDSSTKRSFESAIHPDDVVTIQVDITGLPGVAGVLVGGASVRYSVSEKGESRILSFNHSLTLDRQTARVMLSAVPAPELSPMPSRLNFASVQGINPAVQTMAVLWRNRSSPMNWTAVASAGSAGWLTVGPASGSADGTLTVAPITAGLPPGQYAGELTITATGAANSPCIVTVIADVAMAGTTRYDMNYPSRSALLAAGWDFQGKTVAGLPRNTEFNSSDRLSFNQASHPGTLRIITGDGDLWGNQNNSRNCLFRSLPARWTSIRMKASFRPDYPWEQSGLVVYQDDDNYINLTRLCGAYGDQNNQPAGVTPTYAFNNRLNFVSESLGVGNVTAAVPFPATTFYVRIDCNPSTQTYTAYYSVNGIQWLKLGNITQNLINPRLCIFPGGTPLSVSQKPPLDIEWIEVVVPTGLINGSFESGLAGWSASGNLGVSSGTSYPATEGTRPVVFNWGQTLPNGVLSQSVPTVSGQVYRVQFDLGTIGYNSDEQRLQLTVQGNSPLRVQTLSIFGTGTGVPRWLPQSFDFTADSDATTLVFRDVSSTSQNIDLLMDNVRFTPLPKALSIVRQPASINATVGSAATFEVVAAGQAPLNYQWRRNHVPLAGATASTLTIGNLQTANSGNYDVVISSGLSSITSAAATLTVVTPTVAFANGGFEAGFDGWTASGNERVMSVLPNSATEGSKWVSFNSGQTIPNGVLSQTFATGIGLVYRVTFDYGILAYNFNEQRLQVIIQGAGPLLTQTVSLFGVGNGTVRWQTQSLSFTANTALTTLTFRDLSPSTTDLDLLLDNVRVEPVVPAATKASVLPPPRESAATIAGLQVTDVSRLRDRSQIQFRCSVTGDYLLEWSSDLVGWQPVRQVAGVAGNQILVQVDRPVDLARFYRVRLLGSLANNEAEIMRGEHSAPRE